MYIENFSELLTKYPKYHTWSQITDVEGYESFIIAPEIQWCGPVYIKMDTPFSVIEFLEEHALLALRALTWKVNGGMGKINVKIYINENLFDHEDKNFLLNYLSLIKKTNKIVLHHLDSINFEYSKQIYMYPVRFEEDCKYGGDDWKYPNKWE